MCRRAAWLACSLACVLSTGLHVRAQPSHVLHTFERKQLTNVYFSEGANAGDLNNDGQADVVYGPYWFAGPSFDAKHELYAPQPQNRDGYADHFFAWIHDFNGDGWRDVLTAGFPGTPAYVYENPQQGGFDQPWKKHQVFDWVSNESPQFTNIVGDERPELVCTRDGFFGYATVNWDDGLKPWKFHAISDRTAAPKFGHGLGVGDVNGDGQIDILHAKGWFEQPAENAGDTRWTSHDVSFSNAYGGAEMYVYDVDGDGDNDVITSLAAHDFGLAWYEQVHEGDKVAFHQHTIVGSHPAENRYGVLFSEPHSLNLADIDGDGLKDIITGKTFYSHHKQSPLWDAGAVVYWFRLVRGTQGIDWVPYLADGEAGIGRQVSVVDVQGDGLPDIVVGGMKGAHVLTHRAKSVDSDMWQRVQPKLYDGPPKPQAAEAGRIPGVIEAESLRAKAKVSGGRVQSQAMGNFTAARWSGNSQLFWTGGKPGDKLHIELSLTAAPVELELVLTTAKDYAIVQLFLDDKPLGKPIDLYTPQVTTTGLLRFPLSDIKPGPHKLTVEILGANPKAVKNHLVGLDFIRLRSAADKPLPPATK